MRSGRVAAARLLRSSLLGSFLGTHGRLVLGRTDFRGSTLLRTLALGFCGHVSRLGSFRICLGVDATGLTAFLGLGLRELALRGQRVISRHRPGYFLGLALHGMHEALPRLGGVVVGHLASSGRGYPG